MKIFKKIIKYLNKMKNLNIWGDEDEEDLNYSYNNRVQNPYGVIGLLLSGIGFIFPQLGLSIITLVFCIVTYFTFDKEKEDNPWFFYIGILISLAGLMMFITNATHLV
ncbi:DNA segregation ATPase FtsK/SpoIIIE [Solibacillus silvestris StLB046]|uniref:DNA segregation ATPase FtsK/SpoIIIE n=1 Tax=Solibacillus silvestris (strain StLB046) TaxID=1002809 RepID=F2FAI3_SOLSS|nr:hypothetical protein [Solibacillus silvestris]BAK16750.1 DNA segregation ATPase FtsK/SpoIIIE [Solibacillus silvestris StLB046]